MTTKLAVDPIAQKPYLIELAASYLGGADPRAPLLSSLYADRRGLLPLLVQVGSAETLLDDAVRRSSAAAVRVKLDIWPDMLQVWRLSYRQVAAGRCSLAEAGAFIRENPGSNGKKA